MNVFITGATGFIGKNLIELLLEKGITIIALSTHDEHDISVLRNYGIKNIIFEENLNGQYDLKIDSCIHLASYGVRYGDADLDLMIDVNIKLASKVMRFCIDNNCKVFLSAGSCFEYGTKDIDFLSEEEETNPDDIYAASKVASTSILKTMAKKEGIQFILCRPFGVYGKYEPNHRLLPLIYSHGIHNEPLKMSGGNQLRDFLYVKDVAYAFYEIMNCHGSFNDFDVVNICSGKPCSIKCFVETVIRFKHFSKDLFLFGALPYRKNESMRFVGDNSKIVSLTSWRQRYSLSEGIEDYCTTLEEEYDK